MTTPIINYTELRFTSETEMNRYLDQVEAIWTEEVMAVLQQNGMQRKSVTRIWNQTEQFKLGIVWEYESPQAFKKCQRIISEQYPMHTGLAWWPHPFAVYRCWTGVVRLVVCGAPASPRPRQKTASMQITSHMRPTDCPPGQQDPGAATCRFPAHRLSALPATGTG